MANQDLIRIVEEQKEEINLFDEKDWILREKVSDINIQSSLAQIITGVRRCGKSTLAWQALRLTNFAYLNFDDERFLNFSADRLNDLLEALYTVYGDFDYLLLDEIQNVEGWHLFVNRMLRNKMKVVLTGSNSNLLSREMASHLTGRYAAIELLPFSFIEFLAAKKIEITGTSTAKGKGLAARHFTNYLTSGGFPEVVKGEERKTYIANLFEAIVTRDIIFRYKIRNERTFREVAMWLSGNFAKELSYNRIKNIFGLGSENTAKNYVAYLEDAWLFVSLSKFSYKKQESLRNRKLYITDTSFADLTGESGSENTGRLLENAVMLHLVRYRSRNLYEVFYYKTKIEVDFVIYAGMKVRELLQVSVSIEDQKTRNREVKALIEASQQLACKKLTIITLNETETIENGDFIIHVVPVYDWIRNEVTVD
jgi:uncharacterized protein